MGKINYTLLNASAVNASRLNMTGETGKPGGGAGGYWPAGTPAAIRRSAVLWYDIAKQGATNETMAENPVLKDLSGHGHDATCYNFGWTEESGISTTDYPGALVSDGVDDYALVEGLPIVTDFTIITKRKILTYPFTKQAGFVAKRKDGAGFSFALESYSNEEIPYSVWVFGVRNPVNMDPSLKTISCTPLMYEGQELSKGSSSDTDAMVIFAARLSAENNPFGEISGVLYNFILFNRTLTEEEIEWVKNNLIGNNTEV